MKRISRMCLGRLCDWRWFCPMQIPDLTVSDLRCRVRCRVLDHGSCWQGGVGYIPGVSTAYGVSQDISSSGVQQLEVVRGVELKVGFGELRRREIRWEVHLDD